MIHALNCRQSVIENNDFEGRETRKECHRNMCELNTASVIAADEWNKTKSWSHNYYYFHRHMKKDYCEAAAVGHEGIAAVITVLLLPPLPSRNDGTFNFSEMASRNKIVARQRKREREWGKLRCSFCLFDCSHSPLFSIRSVWITMVPVRLRDIVDIIFRSEPNPVYEYICWMWLKEYTATNAPLATVELWGNKLKCPSSVHASRSITAGNRISRWFIWSELRSRLIHVRSQPNHLACNTNEQRFIGVADVWADVRRWYPERKSLT